MKHTPLYLRSLLTACCAALSLWVFSVPALAQEENVIKGNLVIRNQADVDKHRQITHIGGKLVIKKTKIRELKGFDSLLSVEELYIIGNDYLRTLHAFGKLQKAQLIVIHDNYDIEILPSFDSLTSLGDIEITMNERLVEVVGFSGLIDVNSIKIDDNSSLDLVRGFTNLSSVKDLYISQNPNLARVEGFDSFEAGYIHVYDNPMLGVLPKTLLE